MALARISREVGKPIVVVTVVSMLLGAEVGTVLIEDGRIIGWGLLGF